VAHLDIDDDAFVCSFLYKNSFYEYLNVLIKIDIHSQQVHVHLIVQQNSRWRRSAFGDFICFVLQKI